MARPLAAVSSGFGCRAVTSAEPAKARQAWADYLALGADRSLEALLRRYQAASAAPTVRIATLKGWSKRFGWQARLSDIANQQARETEEREAAARRDLQEAGIAERQNRIAALNDRWQRLQQVIDARAEEHKDVPGGDTGLLVATVKLVKVYDAGERKPDEELEPQPHGGALQRRHTHDVLDPLKQSVEVMEYAVDTGLLKELREHEKQAAQEMGQWTEKQDITSGGKTLDLASLVLAAREDRHADRDP